MECVSPEQQTVGSAYFFINVENGEEDSAALTTAGRRKPLNKSKIAWHKCGKRGHYACECNSSDDSRGEMTPTPWATGSSTTAAAEASNGNRQSGATLQMAAVESGGFDQTSLDFQFLHHDKQCSRQVMESHECRRNGSCWTNSPQLISSILQLFWRTSALHEWIFTVMPWCQQHNKLETSPDMGLSGTTSKGANMKSAIRYEKKLFVYMIFFF